MDLAITSCVIAVVRLIIQIVGDFNHPEGPKDNCYDGSRCFHRAGFQVGFDQAYP